MTYDPKEDAKHFGEDAWVYCSQHMRAHQTGWCTVAVEDKVKLDAMNGPDAEAECRRRGLELYSDFVKSKGREF